MSKELEFSFPVPSDNDGYIEDEYPFGEEVFRYV